METIGLSSHEFRRFWWSPIHFLIVLPCFSLHHACCHCSDSAQILMAPLTTMTFSSKRWNLSSWRLQGGNQIAHMFFDTFFDGCSWIRFIHVYLYDFIYIYYIYILYYITYTEKQCIQHIHVYTMIVRMYNMIYIM